MSNDTNTTATGWVKLYHPSAAQVTIPLGLTAAITESAAQTLMLSINNLLEAGFSVNVPGVEAGEFVEEIGWVLRKIQKNERGDTTPRIEAYPANPALRKKHIHIYLNTEEDVAAFEAACGIKLADMPVYVGKDSVERGADPETDRYIIALPRPARLVWKENPAYDPAETDPEKKKPRRLFVRWMATAAGPGKTADKPGTDEPATPKSTAKPLVPASDDIKAAKETVCHMGKPDVKGRTLGELLQNGRRDVIAFLANTFEPGDDVGKKVKNATSVLLAAQ